MYVPYSGLQLPRSLVISLGSSWPLVIWLLVFCGSLSLRFLCLCLSHASDSCWICVLLASSTCSYHFSPYLPHALTKLANSPKSYSKSPTFSSVIGLCLPLQPMCPQCPHICIIFQSHWTTDFQVPCVDSFFWSEIDHFPLWTAGKLASLALTLASLWNFFWFPKQEMITPYTTGFLTHLEF